MTKNGVRDFDSFMNRTYVGTGASPFANNVFPEYCGGGADATRHGDSTDRIS